MISLIIILIILLLLLLNKQNFDIVKIFDNMFKKRTHYMFSEKEKDETKNLMYEYNYDVNDDIKTMFDINQNLKKNDIYYKSPIPNLDRKSIWHTSFINDENDN